MGEAHNRQWSFPCLDWDYDGVPEADLGAVGTAPALSQVCERKQCWRDAERG